MTTTYRAIGLMSGTSLDGVDIALLETDGEGLTKAGPTGFEPYSDADRDTLRSALVAATALRARTERPPPLDRAEVLVTERHAAAVERFLSNHSVARSAVDVIGFHGQTVLHRPDARLTVQIGDGAVLARQLGIPVVCDMRAADVAAGGQGAPLVPIYHQALVAAAGLGGPTLVINLGGVGNVTLVVAGRDPIALDTGPGNALVDDLMLERTGTAVDRDGAAAAAGHVDATALAALLDHPYFDLPPPKSLDRNAFSRAPVAGLSTADAAATLTAFTAATVAAALSQLPAQPERAIVCGGGASNPSMMRALAARLPCEVVTGAELGWSQDAVEAQAFAYLAVRSRRNLPLTFPTTTGVASPMTGGVLFTPDRQTA